MKYTKPQLTFECQADLLIKRGLIADRPTLIKRLEAVSYYRLSGYLFPFRNSDDTFKNGTTIDTVWKLYTFDRQLRLLILDAIERIEIAVRTNLVYLHVHQHGPFGYTLPESLPCLSSDRHNEFLQKLNDEQNRNKEVFVKHFLQKYGDSHQNLPFWMSCEIMPFGMMLTLLNGVEKPIRQKMGDLYGVSDDVLLSWMRSINGVRNICAHHSRLWNREIGYQPTIPRKNKHPEWHSPVEVTGNRIFGVLTVLKYMLNRIAPQSNWINRFTDLLIRYPEVPKRQMGFADNWQECPIWKLK
ncbi:MAG: DNA-binding protein [Fibrobacter sp.]|nr:DNA-binding protein [Fibrobacter sp.]